MGPTTTKQDSTEARESNTPQRVLNPRAKQRQADKEFFTDLLSSAATKRDAKAYLSRLKSPATSSTDSSSPQGHRARPTAPSPSLENYFGGTRATQESPRFLQYEKTQDIDVEHGDTLHVALVKVNNIVSLEGSILDGISQTLSQLARLSLTPCVVVEDAGLQTQHSWRQDMIGQADRLVTAIEDCGEVRARRLDNIFQIKQGARPEVSMRALLTRPLRQGQIPVIVPVAYSADTHSAIRISADDAVIALTKELAGLNVKPRPDRNPVEEAARLNHLQQSVSVDKVIIIDEIGGIPGRQDSHDTHVFVNLEQEFGSLVKSLGSASEEALQHTSNLKLLQATLRYLPPTSSGLISAPADAANVKTTTISSDEVQSVGTRSQKNALIHNLLTDKPAYSSSLPQGRLQRDRSTIPIIASPTFVKRGMPVTIIPDPNVEPWRSDGPRIQLTDPRIDLPRLVHLIDDSFNRKLDVQHYLSRVSSRIAGVIIAGEYEGGALLTWETPPGIPESDTPRLVPYLDKFAVLKRSQGSGGVADIVFNAMVRDCFPQGVCWRSRKDNPVNKWYFERSRGTWKIPDMNWTMFWTTEEAAKNTQLFLDYEGVCRGVMPSWADSGKPAD